MRSPRGTEVRALAGSAGAVCTVFRRGEQAGNY